MYDMLKKIHNVDRNYVLNYLLKRAKVKLVLMKH